MAPVRAHCVCVLLLVAPSTIPPPSTQLQPAMMILVAAAAARATAAAAPAAALSTSPHCCASLAQATRHMSLLHALLGGAPPTDQQQQLPQLPQLPQQHTEQQHPELPSLCGEPKFKLSLHRRGLRRTHYYAKRKELFARCKHCGATGMPHEFFAGGQSCTGECLQQRDSKSYAQEYKPPL